MPNDRKKPASDKAADQPTVIYTNAGSSAFAVIIPSRPEETPSASEKTTDR